MFALSLVPSNGWKNVSRANKHFSQNDPWMDRHRIDRSGAIKRVSSEPFRTGKCQQINLSSGEAIKLFVVPQQSQNVDYMPKVRQNARFWVPNDTRNIEARKCPNKNIYFVMAGTDQKLSEHGRRWLICNIWWLISLTLQVAKIVILNSIPSFFVSSPIVSGEWQLCRNGDTFGMQIKLIGWHYEQPLSGFIWVT